MSVQRGTPGFNPKVQPGGQPPCPATASRINLVPSAPLLGLGWWERAHGAEGKLRHGTARLSGGAGTALGHPSPAAGPGPDLPVALLGCCTALAGMELGFLAAPELGCHPCMALSRQCVAFPACPRACEPRSIARPRGASEVDPLLDPPARCQQVPVPGALLF